MNSNLVEKLTLITLETLIFCEFSNEGDLRDDDLVELTESITAHLLDLSKEDKKLFLTTLKITSNKVNLKYRNFLKNLPDYLGL